MSDLRSIARTLGGDVVRDGVVFPGPGHSRKDRSASLRLDPNAPDGFVVNSFAGDDPIAIRDYVRPFIGVEPFKPCRSGGVRTEYEDKNKVLRFSADTAAKTDRGEQRIRLAAGIWHDGRGPRGTIVQDYLASRCLDLPDDVAGHVLRFHPACPWKDEETGRVITVPAMLALMRSIVTNEITAIQRTRLTADGRKIERRMLGIAAGAATKVDGDDAVTMGLAIGEGVETALAARQLGIRPAWALGSAGSIAAFPVLGGIEVLTVLAEHNKDGTPNAASKNAVADVGHRWHAAGRKVVVVDPPTGSTDVNDALMNRRRQCAPR